MRSKKGREITEEEGEISLKRWREDAKEERVEAAVDSNSGKTGMLARVGGLALKLLLFILVRRLRYSSNAVA